jgi:hypothetical protein
MGFGAVARERNDNEIFFTASSQSDERFLD